MATPRLPVLRPRGRRRPEGYDSGYEREVTLADGRVAHLRPVVPTDIDELRRAVAEADQETIRRRFLGGRPPDTDEAFERLVTVDYDRRFAVVALSDSHRGIGIARYEALPGQDAADVAVAVDPGWRRVGLATALLRLLGEAALDHDVYRFTADFLTENADVAAILEASGLPIDHSEQQGVVEAEVDLSAADVGLVGSPPVGS